MNATENETHKHKKPGKYYALIGLFILTIAVAHFAMQLTFIQRENIRSVETAAEIEAVAAPPGERYIEIAPEQYEVKKIEVITIPEVVKPAARARKEIAPPPVRKTVKKKDPVETRAERLRRAERILTGV